MNHYCLMKVKLNTLRSGLRQVAQKIMVMDHYQWVKIGHKRGGPDNFFIKFRQTQSSPSFFLKTTFAVMIRCQLRFSGQKVFCRFPQ